METKHRKAAKFSAGALVAVAMMASAQESRATTFANTGINNTVTVAYKSLGNVDYSASATVTVTVNLVKAAPTLAFIANSPLATLAAPTEEATPVAQTYGITSNANGLVQHILNLAAYTPSDISAATAVSAAQNVWLGATSLGLQATAATDIYVPLDTCVSGTGNCDYTATNATIGGTDGIAVNDFVVIGAAQYTVTAIDNTAAAHTSGKYAKLTLNAAVTANPGTQIGEYKVMTANLTTGSLAAGETEGSYAASITATDGTNTTAAVTDGSVYVSRCNMEIRKSVSVNGGTTWTDSTFGTNTAPGTAAPVASDPNQEILYRLTARNTAANKACKNIVITDDLSPYVAFKVGSLTFTDDTPASGITFISGTNDSYLDQANAAVTPASAGGGAPANYDARVGKVVVTFNNAGDDQMDPGAEVILNYRAWLH